MRRCVIFPEAQKDRTTKREKLAVSANSVKPRFCSLLIASFAVDEDEDDGSDEEAMLVT